MLRPAMSFLRANVTVPLLLSAIVLSALACSSDSDDGGAATTGAGGAAGSGTAGSGTAGSGTAGSGTAGTQSGTLPDTFATYIELGDSISDKGGGAPFFYDLLFENDDTQYPTWAGKDLKTRFKVQQHVHGSKAGATSQNMKAQVDALPASLPGPVFVSVTIGGNDMQKYALDILQGKDEADKMTFRANLGKYLDALTAPNRFGEGVQVYVFAADIYDPSDGKGDFKNYCGGILGAYPVTPTDGFWTAWNAIVTEETTARGAKVLPLHDTFMGHGISFLKDGSSWFVSDCIHPSKTGHHELRKLFWKGLTGETLD